MSTPELGSSNKNKEIGAILPPNNQNAQGKPRHIGIEVEFAGVSADFILEKMLDRLGGEIKTVNSVEFELLNTKYGTFKLELDASLLKKMAAIQQQDQLDNGEDSLIQSTMELVTRAAEHLVPWEIVSPPIPIKEITCLDSLMDDLREGGALGTRHAIHHAFGVHLNPDLPAHDVRTILAYLRAYMCLFDWICEREQIDMTRRLSTYIKHFDREYIAKVISPHYAPDMNQLIDDYVHWNPSRNRSLDMLPLFAFIDDERVRSAVADERVNARPTFHYRLPNCDIDNPEWSLSFPWMLWLQVEKLAADETLLEECCQKYLSELGRITHPLESRWLTEIEALIRAE